MKAPFLLSLATGILLSSCAKNKDEELPPEPLEKITETEPSEAPAPVVEKPLTTELSKKTPLFVDPPTHNELMSEADKKTIISLPETPQDTPPLPKEPGIIITPPTIPPPPLNLSAN